MRYDDLEALTGASFHLCAKEFVAVIGPNGAGKSTLLKAMLGLVPHGGQVTFSARLEPHPTRRVAYVPQSRALDWSFP
ncbi:MAG: ATP-binding cassette domain-containing protein, partial [Pleurocapsa sp. SU_196_0]|nr:ATP-binding cassette domain-containing protein [Pleurocapsa sp. SU_196_0]